jgi:hypothetical protein
MKNAVWFGLGLAVGVVGILLWDQWQRESNGLNDESELSDTIDQQLLSLETRADIQAQAARN